MTDLTARLFWVTAVSCGLGYMFFLMFGSLFIVPQTSHVIIRDAVAAGQHSFSGMVMVPTPCDELTVRTGMLSSTIYTLELTTWQDPSVKCPQTVTPRAFNTVAFAPAFGVQFLVFLDGAAVPFDITSVIQKKQP